MRQTISSVEPRQGLLQETVLKMHKQEIRLRAQRRFWVFSIILAFSIALIDPVLRILMEEVQESGFTSFLSLIFSDGSVVLAHWQEFGYSLLETLPIGTLFASLGLCMLCLLASRKVIRESGFILARRNTA